MFKMTLLWLLIYVGGALASFINPIYGLAVYLFEYYLRPSLHWWGKPLPDWRWSLIISMVVLITYVIKRTDLPEPKTPNPAMKWLLALCGLMLVVTFTTAVDTSLSWNQTFLFLKFVMLYGLIVGIVKSEKSFDIFVAMHMAGAAWWGWEAYTDPSRSQGRLLNVGSADTLNDNLASAHLLTVLPFIAIYLLTSKDKRLRLLALLAAPFVINTIILCNSRGATVGMVAAVMAAFLLVRRGQRIRLIGVACLAVVAFLTLADPEFLQRQQTTVNYEDESTARARFTSWMGGVRLIRDHPFGAGGKGYNVLSPIYIPSIVESHEGDTRSPHNTYVLVAAEWGPLGLGLFLAFIASTFLALRRVQKRALTTDGFHYRALALQLGLIGTLVAGTFSDRFYGESVYWMCALAIALERIQAFSLEATTVPIEQPAAAGPDPRRGVAEPAHA